MHIDNTFKFFIHEGFEFAFKLMLDILYWLLVQH